MMEPELRTQFIKQKVTQLLWLLVKAVSVSVSVSVGVTVAVSRLGCIGWRTKTPVADYWNSLVGSSK